jgi:hypothetical protein
MKMICKFYIRRGYRFSKVNDCKDVDIIGFSHGDYTWRTRNSFRGWVCHLDARITDVTSLQINGEWFESSSIIEYDYF